MGGREGGGDGLVTGKREIVAGRKDKVEREF